MFSEMQNAEVGLRQIPKAPIVKLLTQACKTRCVGKSFEYTIYISSLDVSKDGLAWFASDELGPFRTPIGQFLPSESSRTGHCHIESE